ncbi:ribosomal protein S18-alanine N-acetyltransferase [Eupransor demetentiae]|uniref:Ribosomal protein S18 acetylase RimI and related acetyltransferases (RimI) n=1 Tax=Eupransor demetentiae TaxID=3109584 RepID=A0ABM9N5T8_9LACO|nr:Ribosomal protein S18 acetylase RimI and related acetyltransferases (RimI) [Lactobacillaceae bacterium LMG 33000]
MFLKSKKKLITSQPAFADYQPVSFQQNEEDFLVRRAEMTDLDHLVKIQEAVYDGYAPWVKGDFLQELSRPADRIYLVVEHREQVVAFMGLSWRPEHSDIHITNVAVLPVWQGQGLGSQLISLAQDLTQCTTESVLSLEVRRSNYAAQRLYRRLGFQQVAVMKRYYRDDHEDALSMVSVQEDA